MVDIHLFISREVLGNFFTLLSEVTWLAPTLFSHINRLGGLKQNSVPDSSDDRTSIDNKAVCVLLKGMSGSAKRLQKFTIISLVIALVTIKPEQYNYQKTADDKTTSALH